MMSNFSNYVTRTAFQLSLSQDMVRALALAMHYHSGKSTAVFMDFGRSVPAMKAILNRGLVEHHPRQHNEDPNHRYYTLTEAGMHVYRLCQLAGLLPVEAPNEVAA